MKISSVILAIVLFLKIDTSHALTCEEQRALDIKNFIELCNPNGNSCPSDGTNAWGRSKIKVRNDQGVTALLCYLVDCVYNQELYFPTHAYTIGSCNSDKTPMRIFGGVDISKFEEAPLCKKGSIINVSTQSLGESVPIDGVNFEMSYYSDFHKGKVSNNQFELPLTENNIAPDITAIDVEMRDLSLNIYSSISYSNAANLSFLYNWNGLDHLGNPVNKPKTFKVKAVEYRTYTGGSLNIPYDFEITLGGFDANTLGLGGWVPNVLHFYDSEKKMLYYTDGVKRQSEGLPFTSSTYLVPEQDVDLVYEFDINARQIATRHKKTGAVLLSFNYDTFGRLLSISEPFSRTTTFERNGAGDFSAIISPKGKRTEVTLDPNGFVQSFQSTDLRTYSMTTTSNGLLTSFQKPGGQFSTFTYNTDGTLFKDEHSGGYFTQLVKSVNGRDTIMVASSPNSMSTTYTINPYTGYRTTSHHDGRNIYENYNSNTYTLNESYNGANMNLYYSSDPVWGSGGQYPSSTTYWFNTPYVYLYSTFTKSSTLTNTSDPFSLTNESTVENKSGYTSTLTFNGSTKTYTKNSFVGRTSIKQIDNFGRTIYSRFATYDPINYTYTNENLTKIAQGGREINFAYNVLTGNLISMTDSLLRTTTYSYDSADRVSQVQLPDLRTINYTYDSNGNLLSIDNPSRKLHEFNFGSNELISSYLPPILSGAYPISYIYDSSNRPSQISKGPGRNLNFTYNSSRGYLEKINTKEGNYLFQYSNARPARIEGPSGFFENIATLDMRPYVSQQFGPDSIYMQYIQGLSSSTGDVLNEQITMQGSAQPTVNYTYDNDSLMTNAGSLSITRSSSNGTISTTALGNITDTYGYNSFGELTSYESADPSRTLYSLSLSRDTIGRVSEKTETLFGYAPITYNYVYDLAGRLVEVKENTVTVATYTYDNNGNRNGGTIRGVTQTANHDDHDRVIAYNSNSYTHDIAGEWLTRTNSVTGVTTTFAYSELGGLKSVIPSTGNQVTYTLDGSDRRVLRKINGTTDKRYYYDTWGRLLIEADPLGTPLRRYVYGTKSHVPDYFVEAGENYKIISDYLGSPRIVVKVSDGSFKQVMNHDEFGRVSLDTNPGAQAFGFAGGVYDEETKLVRFGVRDYDSESARWTAKDPILFNGGDTNLFGYVQNDPVNFIDPEGTFPWAIAAAFLGSYFWSSETDTPGAATSELWQVPAAGLMCGGAVGGKEIVIGGMRFAPFGNRTGNPTGQLPHYHRSVPNPARPGQSIPGQGIGRHRPWDVKSPDKSFWDRF